jgi:hypothetical protein
VQCQAEPFVSPAPSNKDDAQEPNHDQPRSRPSHVLVKPSQNHLQKDVYFAKCKSYASHFLALTWSTFNPGFPYVNGAKNR